MSGNGHIMTIEDKIDQLGEVWPDVIIHYKSEHVQNQYVVRNKPEGYDYKISSYTGETLIEALNNALEAET